MTFHVRIQEWIERQQARIQGVQGSGSPPLVAHVVGFLTLGPNLDLHFLRVDLSYLPPFKNPAFAHAQCGLFYSKNDCVKQVWLGLLGSNASATARAL